MRTERREILREKIQRILGRIARILVGLQHAKEDLDRSTPNTKSNLVVSAQCAQLKR